MAALSFCTLPLSKSPLWRQPRSCQGMFRAPTLCNHTLGRGPHRSPSATRRRQQAPSTLVRGSTGTGPGTGSGDGGEEAEEQGGKNPQPSEEEASPAAGGAGASSSSSPPLAGSESSEAFRQRMEALVEAQGKDEAFFDGKELARIIYSKFGRSYDVTFIRQEFMGRKLLALNVMWKYREQKSFPLTEEEYLYRLDRVAENLRFWGAVGLVRQSLATTKERPRIGKAVSIQIGLDESGERSSEWINR